MSQPRTPAQSAAIAALTDSAVALWTAVQSALSIDHPHADPVGMRASIDAAVAAFGAAVVSHTPIACRREVLRDAATQIAEYGLAWLEGPEQLLEVLLPGEGASSQRASTDALCRLIPLLAAAVCGRL